MDVQDWWSGGQLVPLELGGSEQGVFVRREGSGPSMTLLHGFPSSSHDWAKIAPALAERYALAMPDLLGFGASTKPHEHRYSLLEQADLVEALWASEGIKSTVVVAHDYSVSVAQELLSRRAAGALAVDLRALHFMNGGIYPDLHRQIRYIEDRRENAERWTQVLQTTDVPLTFVWGMLDPVSGAHMAERIRERLPDAPFTALEDVAHWPPLEAPERVVAALLGRRP